MRVYITVALTHGLFPFYILIYIDCIFNLCICQVKCGVLWSRGYFVSTVGHISEATVIKYIEEQKDDK